METTPPPYHRPSSAKSASRLARVNDSKEEEKEEAPPNLCLDLVCQLSPKSNDTPTPCPPPPLPRASSSPSPLRRSKTRLDDRLQMEASEDAAAAALVVRKQGKAKGGQKSLLASPRNPRRSRRRSEAVAESVIEEAPKPRKRKPNVARTKKEQKQTSSSSSHLPSNKQHSLSFLLSARFWLDFVFCEDDASCQSDLNRVGEIISDLVMWRDVAKSTLWFGFGCLSFLSSCFAKGLNFRYIMIFSLFLDSFIKFLNAHQSVLLFLKPFLGGFQSRTCVTLRLLLVKHSFSKVHLHCFLFPLSAVLFDS